MTMRFQDQTIVITGASMGIGRALAIALAARGAKLALAARSAEALAETVQLCEAAGGTAIAVPTDITEPTACQALIQQMERRQREVIMTPKGKLLPWGNLVAPGLMDWLAVRATQFHPMPSPADKQSPGTED